MLLFKGPRGSLYLLLKNKIPLTVSDNIITIVCPSSRHYPAFNTYIASIHRTIAGVTMGYRKKLRIVGVGYKAFLEKEKALRLVLGYSHKNFLGLYKNILTKFGRKNNRLILKGPSLPGVYTTAAALHVLKKPDIYRGKGIRY
jgi:large subunit ribosomal protein L6